MSTPAQSVWIELHQPMLVVGSSSPPILRPVASQWRKNSLPTSQLKFLQLQTPVAQSL
ncbi:Hypothetical protein FKW44_005068 [Caligus rogercresseyi]|uniref:Uncharacterized protein n=1 Tax=Caligus rogercresseyi TaxID=217165 RepID=A0A7T8KBG0_CALRO|nr:Hypothetical protein FKW44_005068 [Caligus rogercresseyi]